jgi:CheY-like chemotaxis protein
LLRLFLERAGGQVIAVADGLAVIEAVQKARAEGAPIDIAILDVQMPGLDGHETTRRLRAEGFTNPIIGLTAGTMRGERDKCLHAGFDSYLSKPIEQPTLLEIVRRYTQKSSDEDRTNRGNASAEP